MTDPVFALEPDVPRNVRLARWLLFRLLSGLREGSLTVREGAQTFHFGDPAATPAPRRGRTSPPITTSATNFMPIFWMTTCSTPARCLPTTSRI